MEPEQHQFTGAELDALPLEELVPLLDSEDEHLPYHAATAMAKRHPKSLPRLYELAEEPLVRVRAQACWALGQTTTPAWEPMIYPASIEILLRHMEQDPEAEVRASAAAAFGHLRYPEILPRLCAAVGDPSADVRFDVAAALGAFYDSAAETWGHHKPLVTATLLRLMDDPDEDVRDWATFGIHQGGHDTPEARARLWQALDDPKPEVRGEAAAALAIFGDRSFIPRLAELLREDEWLSPCYFEAAEEFGDPTLLPAVLEGAERWRDLMEPGEVPNSDVESAVKALRKAAGVEAPSG
jgi:HEAT repeat protein